MTSPPETLRSRLARIRLVALDVDGVLTDGRVVYAGRDELQAFDVQDGFGLNQLRLAGIDVVWITGRGCEATRLRARELRIRELHTQSGPKDEILTDLQASLGHGPEATLAMGDDLPDLRMALRAAVFCAPANARDEVRERADLVTEASGGRGAVRELCEAVLQAQGRWQACVSSYREGDPQR